MSFLSSAGDAPAKSFRVLPGQREGMGRGDGSSHYMTAHVLNLLSDAKFSFADCETHPAGGTNSCHCPACEGLTGFGVLGPEIISSSFDHNTFLKSF